MNGYIKKITVFQNVQLQQFLTLFKLDPVNKFYVTFSFKVFKGTVNA